MPLGGKQNWFWSYIFYFYIRGKLSIILCNKQLLCQYFNFKDIFFVLGTHWKSYNLNFVLLFFSMHETQFNAFYFHRVRLDKWCFRNIFYPYPSLCQTPNIVGPYFVFWLVHVIVYVYIFYYCFNNAFSSMALKPIISAGLVPVLNNTEK